VPAFLVRVGFFVVLMNGSALRTVND